MIKDWFREVLVHRGKALVLSGLLLLVCFGGVAYQGGLLYGIDFTGGLRILLEFDEPLGTEDMTRVRSIFSENFTSARVQTVSLKGEARRRGLMVTVRARGFVDRLTQQLYTAGRQGASDPFSGISNVGKNAILGREILQENFTVGGNQEERLDLSRASRKTIRRRVQSLVNKNLSNRVLDILRDELVSSTGGIDLNWANDQEIRGWLADRQAEGFVEQLVKLRSGNQLSKQSLRKLLEQFGLSEDTFLNIFRLTGDDPDRLDLNEIPRENLRNVVFQEFFQDRYSDVASQVVERRQDRGLFRSASGFLGLGALENLYRPSLEGEFYLSPFIIKSREMISPSIGAELIADAALAILLSLVGILIYLYVRFELNYSFGAIGAIIHDVLLTVGLLTLLGVEFNVPVVAAVLTVIGYSLNDTIVNFDRVRENRVLMGHDASWYKVINRSVLEVLNRTFVTSITTFIAALVLYLYGGIALRGFAITLIIGVIAGTYSSIFISNVILYELQKRFS